MEKPNLVTLKCHNGIYMFWQSDKNDFVLLEDWKTELHTQKDYEDAIFVFNENRYIGSVEFDYNEEVTPEFS